MYFYLHLLLLHYLPTSFHYNHTIYIYYFCYYYLLKSNHMAMKYEMEDKVLKYYPAKMAETRMFIRALGEDQTIRDLYPVKEDSFAMTVQGQT